MFSEYTSKFLSQSQAGSSSQTAPLFHSTVEEAEEESNYDSPSVYSSKFKKKSTGAGGWVSSFAARPNRTLQGGLKEDDNNDDDDDDEGEGEDLDPQWRTMGSSTSTNGLDSVRLDQSAIPKDSHDHDDEDDHHHQQQQQHQHHHDPPEDIAVEANDLPQFKPLDFAISRMDHDPESSYVPPEVTKSVIVLPDVPKFDKAWATAYILSVCSVLATSVMIWLQTTVPKAPLGDTIYTVIKKSSGMITLSAFISVGISIAWILIARRYSRWLIYTSVVCVPLGMVSMTLYSLIMSYRTPDGGFGSQDRAMRWSSLLSLILTGVWCFMIYRGRDSLRQSVGIVELACRIISQNRPLMLMGLGTIAVFLTISFVWVGIFGRVFLQGHFLKTQWILDVKTWVLGAWYVLVYLWTWGVVANIQRCAIAVTISQWYFHRHEPPQPSDLSIVKAGLEYASSIQFGTVCLSAFLRLAIRVPLFVAPRRLVFIFQLAVRFLVSSSASILNVTTPLALTNAVINTQTLSDAARAMALFESNPRVNWRAYRLSKLLLSAARGLTAVIVGVVSWVHAATYTNGGSLYGYIVGLISGFIGWVVLGATEGVMSNVVDAAFVCFALDQNNGGGHCNEADIQFTTYH